MSDDAVIRVENLSKQYRIGAREGYKTFRETLVDAAKAPFQRLNSAFGSVTHQTNQTNETTTTNKTVSSNETNLIWALRDVSFEAKQGEVVGIIGRNGAGKSTLLKILSKITEPTEGRVELRGRVGSLLEVGTGFHPELTGHENIYLYGAILGMDRWEVTTKFDEIVAFAELEKFIDTPVKRYSSGMYMRLAFAVAAHLEPEILLVDEVLAVGDAAFQKKCLSKMSNVSKEGRTVLFVSHNLHAVIKLCSRALLIDHGNITVDGPVLEVTDKYTESYLVQTQKGEVLLRAWNENRTSPGKARIAHLKTLNRNGDVCSVFEIDERITFEVMMENLSPLGFVLSFSIQNKYDVLVYHIRSQDSHLKTEEIGTLARVRMTIPQLRIVEGTYTVNVWLGNHLDQLEDRVGNALVFHVTNKGRSVAPLQSIIHETGEWLLCNREDR